MSEPTFRDNRKHNADGTVVDPSKIKTTLASNNVTLYTTVLWDDSEYSCSCPGWCIKRKGKDRTCKHIKASRACNAADMTPLDEFVVPAQGQMSGSQVVIPQREFRNIRIRK